MASAAARNSIFGGDPLASFLALDGVAPSAAAAAAHPDGPALLRVDDIRKLLRGNLAALRAAGLVYDHTFHGASLGLSITLERYRGGRTFVGVDGTREGSEAYSVIRPTDELVAVSGEAICEPTQKSFDTLRETIVRAERPLVLTFVRGRGRDAAFQDESKRNAQPAAYTVDESKIAGVDDDSDSAKNAALPGLYAGPSAVDEDGGSSRAGAAASPTDVAAAVRAVADISFSGTVFTTAADESDDESERRLRLEQVTRTDAQAAAATEAGALREVGVDDVGADAGAVEYGAVGNGSEASSDCGAALPMASTVVFKKRRGQKDDPEEEEWPEKANGSEADMDGDEDAIFRVDEGAEYGDAEYVGLSPDGSGPSTARRFAPRPAAAPPAPRASKTRSLSRSVCPLFAWRACQSKDATALNAFSPDAFAQNVFAQNVSSPTASSPTASSPTASSGAAAAPLAAADATKVGAATAAARDAGAAGTTADAEYDGGAEERRLFFSDLERLSELNRISAETGREDVPPDARGTAAGGAAVLDGAETGLVDGGADGTAIQEGHLDKADAGMPADGEGCDSEASSVCSTMVFKLRRDQDDAEEGRPSSSPECASPECASLECASPDGSSPDGSSPDGSSPDGSCPGGAAEAAGGDSPGAAAGSLAPVRALYAAVSAAGNLEVKGAAARLAARLAESSATAVGAEPPVAGRAKGGSPAEAESGATAAGDAAAARVGALDFGASAALAAAPLGTAGRDCAEAAGEDEGGASTTAGQEERSLEGSARAAAGATAAAIAAGAVSGGGTTADEAVVSRRRTLLQVVVTDDDGGRSEVFAAAPASPPAPRPRATVPMSLPMSPPQHAPRRGAARLSSRRTSTLAAAGDAQAAGARLVDVVVACCGGAAQPRGRELAVEYGDAYYEMVDCPATLRHTPGATLRANPGDAAGAAARAAPPAETPPRGAGDASVWACCGLPEMLSFDADDGGDAYAKT